MKALQLLAAFMILSAPALAQETDTAKTTSGIISRRSERSSTTTVASDKKPLLLADQQSKVDAATFAANVMLDEASRHAWERGISLNCGFGYTRLNTGEFTQTTSYGEILKTTDTSDSVPFAHLEMLYQFDEAWDIELGAAIIDAAEIQVSFPTYANVSSMLPPPNYSRNVMMYEMYRFSLMPSYTFAVGDRIRVRAGAGINHNRTKSHFETTYYASFSGRPPGMFSENSPDTKYDSWGGVVALRAEWEFGPHTSIGLSCAYSPFQIGVASMPLARYGATQPSRSTVTVDSFEAAFTFIVRK
jgi:hypothetical protein